MNPSNYTRSPGPTFQEQQRESENWLITKYGVSKEQAHKFVWDRKLCDYFLSAVLISPRRTPMLT